MLQPVMMVKSSFSKSLVLQGLVVSGSTGTTEPIMVANDTGIFARLRMVSSTAE